MGKWKSQLASRMRKFFKWLDKVYWKENCVWSPGYFIISVGIDEETVENYIELQGRQDLGQLRIEL